MEAYEAGGLDCILSQPILCHVALHVVAKD